MRLMIVRSARLRSGAACERLSPLLRQLADAFEPRHASVQVNWIGERTMAHLNRAYTRRTGAAEILSFSCAGGLDPGKEIPLGEIYLCWTRLLRAARRNGVPPRAYGARLLVHGLFHLRGLRHDDARSAARMEAAEARFLRAYLTEREVERLFA